ncbi:MAG: hypothetical protein IEMM0008_0397 [bacterium]|nr:MAG: hypothetical protein IEMM0008_0397 [bacterium]
MKRNQIIQLFVIILAVVYLNMCGGSGDFTYDGDGDLIVKYYKKYRFLSNNIVTFRSKDELSKDEAKKRPRYFKAFYSESKKTKLLVTLETYTKGSIRKRQTFNPKIGNLTRMDTFVNGELNEYYIYFYDENDSFVLVKREVFSNKKILKRVEKHGFGALEEIDYYNSETRLTKTEADVANKVDTIKYYDKKGNIVRETGTYDNGRYPYVIKYSYDKDNHMIKVENTQRGQRSAVYYYNSDGSYAKEERYDEKGKLTEVIKYDKNGNPIKDGK